MRKEKKISKLLLVIIVFAAIQNQIFAQNERYDPVKEPLFDKKKIINDIKNMSIWDIKIYSHDLALYERRFKAAIFASEWAIQKYGDETKKWPVFYHTLGWFYLNIKNFDKSYEYYAKAFQYQNYPSGIPKIPDKLKLYQMEEMFFFIEKLYEESLVDRSLLEKTVEYARKFKEKYPDAKGKFKNIDVIFEDYQNVQNEKANLEKIKGMAQAFLDEMAGYINRKDKDGLRKFFIDNMEDKERAEYYAERWYVFFSVADEIHFPILKISGELDRYLIIYDWDINPKGAIKEDPEAIGHPSFEFRFHDNKLILLE